MCRATSTCLGRARHTQEHVVCEAGLQLATHTVALVFDPWPMSGDLALIHFNDVYNIQDGKFARFMKELQAQADSMRARYGEACGLSCGHGLSATCRLTNTDRNQV